MDRISAISMSSSAAIQQVLQRRQQSQVDPFVKALSSKLGIDSSTLSQAIDEIWSSQSQTQGARGSQGNEGNKDKFVSALSSKLGIDETTLQTALDEVKSERPAARPHLLHHHAARDHKVARTSSSAPYRASSA